MTETNDANERLDVRSSRLWALFHFNLTRLLFPLHMAADRLGVSTSDVKFWLTPWQRTDEHLPLSHIAEVAHTRGFFWDAISVESSGGANPLWITGVSKSAARYFVDHVRARLNEFIPPTPRNRAVDTRHCERSEAIQFGGVALRLLRRFAPRNDGRCVTPPPQPPRR